VPDVNTPEENEPALNGRKLAIGTKCWNAACIRAEVPTRICHNSPSQNAFLGTDPAEYYSRFLNFGGAKFSPAIRAGVCWTHVNGGSRDLSAPRDPTSGVTELAGTAEYTVIQDLGPFLSSKVI